MVHLSPFLHRIWCLVFTILQRFGPGAKGEGLTFYGSEEAIIAYNEKKCDLHSQVKVIVDDLVDGKLQKRNG